VADAEIDELKAPEIEVAMALGMRSAALVTSEVPLKTATGIPVIVAFRLTLLMVLVAILSEAKLCKADELIAVALDKTPGKTDFNIPGRAEARTLGILETIEAKSVGLMLAGMAVAVIPADDKADCIASVGTDVILLADKIEDKLPALTAEAKTSVGIAVILLADKIEDKFPAATAEATTPVGTMVMLFAARSEDKPPDASIEDKFPAATAEATTPVGTMVMLFAARSEDKPPDAINDDKLPTAMAEDKLLAIEVGVIELLEDTAEEMSEAALDVAFALTIEAKFEEISVEAVKLAEAELALAILEDILAAVEETLAEAALALAILEDISAALEETLAKAAESDLGSIGVVAVAIIEEMLAR
jgi:hypothetical protein